MIVWSEVQWLTSNKDRGRILPFRNGLDDSELDKDSGKVCG